MNNNNGVLERMMFMAEMQDGCRGGLTGMAAAAVESFTVKESQKVKEVKAKAECAHIGKCTSALRWACLRGNIPANCKIKKEGDSNDNSV